MACFTRRNLQRNNNNAKNLLNFSVAVLLLCLVCCLAPLTVFVACDNQQQQQKQVQQQVNSQQPSQLDFDDADNNDNDYYNGEGDYVEVATDSFDSNLNNDANNAKASTFESPPFVADRSTNIPKRPVFHDPILAAGSSNNNINVQSSDVKAVPNFEQVEDEDEDFMLKPLEADESDAVPPAAEIPRENIKIISKEHKFYTDPIVVDVEIPLGYVEISVDEHGNTIDKDHPFHPDNTEKKKEEGGERKQVQEESREDVRLEEDADSLEEDSFDSDSSAEFQRELERSRQINRHHHAQAEVRRRQVAGEAIVQPEFDLIEEEEESEEVEDDEEDYSRSQERISIVGGEKRESNAAVSKSNSNSDDEQEENTENSDEDFIVFNEDVKSSVTAKKIASSYQSQLDNDLGLFDEGDDEVLIRQREEGEGEGRSSANGIPLSKKHSPPKSHHPGHNNNNKKKHHQPYAAFENASFEYEHVMSALGAAAFHLVCFGGIFLAVALTVKAIAIRTQKRNQYEQVMQQPPTTTMTASSMLKTDAFSPLASAEKKKGAASNLAMDTAIKSSNTAPLSP